MEAQVSHFSPGLAFCPGRLQPQRAALLQDIQPHQHRQTQTVCMSSLHVHADKPYCHPQAMAARSAQAPRVRKWYMLPRKAPAMPAPALPNMPPAFQPSAPQQVISCYRGQAPDHLPRQKLPSSLVLPFQVHLPSLLAILHSSRQWFGFRKMKNKKKKMSALTLSTGKRQVGS